MNLRDLDPKILHALQTVRGLSREELRQMLNALAGDFHSSGGPMDQRKGRLALTNDAVSISLGATASLLRLK